MIEEIKKECNMFLHVDDIAKIQEILSKFPDVENFEIVQNSDSGIGTKTTMLINTTVNGLNCTVGFVVSSVENW